MHSDQKILLCTRANKLYHNMNPAPSDLRACRLVETSQVKDSHLEFFRSPTPRPPYPRRRCLLILGEGNPCLQYLRHYHE